MPKRRQKKTKAENEKELEIENLSGQENKSEMNQPPAEVIEKIELADDKAAEKKKLLMWVGISCLMVIFFVAWIFNLKYEFKASLSRSSKSEFNWSQSRAELDKAMAKIKQGLAEIKKIRANLKPEALSGELSPTAEQIDLLKGKLLNEVATGTATSTVKN